MLKNLIKVFLNINLYKKTYFVCTFYKSLKQYIHKIFSANIVIENKDFVLCIHDDS